MTENNFLNTTLITPAPYALQAPNFHAPEANLKAQTTKSADSMVKLQRVIL